MAYTSASVGYGDISVLQALVGSAPRIEAIGDSYATNLNSIFSRLPYAIVGMGPWTHVSTLPMATKILGADGDYNLNATTGMSQQAGLATAAIHYTGTGSGGARDIPGLWALTDNAHEGYSDDGGTSHAFTTFGLYRDTFFGLTAGTLFASTSNQEFCRITLQLDRWNNKASCKLLDSDDQMAYRHLVVHSTGAAGALDNVVRRFVDVTNVARTTGVTLADWPEYRQQSGTHWRPGTGSLNGAGTTPSIPATSSEAGILNATRFDSAHANVNAQGDFIFTTPDGSGNYKFAIRGASAISSGDWLAYGGGVAIAADSNGDYVEGVNFGCIGTNSASYDNVGGLGTNKDFTEAQYSRYLYLTAMDLDQDTVFIYDFAEEPGSLASVTSDIQAMIETVDGAASDAGITNRYHLVITSFMHIDASVEGTPSEVDDSRTIIETNRSATRDAIDAVAIGGIKAYNISLYDALSGILFDGTGTSATDLESYIVDPSAYAWGDGQEDDLSSGNLLDATHLHIGSEASSAFFAEMFWDAVNTQIEAASGSSGVSGVAEAFVIMKKKQRR